MKFHIVDRNKNASLRRHLCLHF